MESGPACSKCRMNPNPSLPLGLVWSPIALFSLMFCSHVAWTLLTPKEVVVRGFSRKSSALWPRAPVTLGSSLTASYTLLWSAFWGKFPFSNVLLVAFVFFRISSQSPVYQMSLFFHTHVWMPLSFATFSSSLRIWSGREACRRLSWNRDLPFKIEIANIKGTKHQPPPVLPSPSNTLPTF